MTDCSQVAQAVLAAGMNPFATLSLAPGLPPVTEATPVADARRHYMRLAALIHPDKLKSTFDKATEAFQSLVHAFECFADPAARREAARKYGGGGMKRSKPSPRDEQKSRKAGRAAKTKAKKRTRLEDDSSAGDDASGGESDDRDEDDGNSESGNDWDGFLAKDVEPTVSNNRTPIGEPRTGYAYRETTIGCPNCRSLWEPDSKPQYSLFMGRWGKKVHCQLCLFAFGCATAIHACPHCSAAFSYDSSMYDTMENCAKCKGVFGFPYYPVNARLVDLVRLEEWRERKEREKTKEREARAAARRGDVQKGSVGAVEEKVQMLLGTCVMDDECPLCHQRVKSKHKQHMTECMSRSSEERQAHKSTVAAVAKSAPVKKPTPKKPAAKKPTAKKAPAKKIAKRRHRGSSDSEDDLEDDESESEFSESESEPSESFSDSDDGDDDDESD